MTLCVFALVGCSSGHRVATGSSATFARGAVAADHAIASAAGAEMLTKGGNAVDAAVAASFTLSVVRPYSCGIGGGGFMVIHLADDPIRGKITTAINYRETSPVGPDFFERTGRSSTVGGAAVAVPGTVAGLIHALENYGTFDLEEVLAPAIRACREGFVVDDHYQSMADGLIARFKDEPALQDQFPFVWNHFLREGNVAVGDRITNLAQRDALELISRFGTDAFRENRMGSSIEKAVDDAGGDLRIDDLLGYRPSETEPLIAKMNGLSIVSMPPPSSGGVTIVETLLILDRLGFDVTDPIDTDDERHLLAESLKHAFADRSRWLADPVLVYLPIDRVLSDENISRMAQLIDAETHDANHYGTHGVLGDDAGTSHVSVVDQWGGAVACTETINLEFGSLVGVDAFGFVLNNEMDDFTTVRGKPNSFGLTQSDRNLPERGKRPLSSMSPTIVLDERGVLLIAGASGGPRIITGTLQAMLNALAGMSAEDAVGSPRFHHQWQPNRLYLEPEADAWIEGFRDRGHAIDFRKDVGNVQLIRRSPKGWQAASDPRKGGRPAGH